jgi:cytochrome c553
VKTFLFALLFPIGAFAQPAGVETCAACHGQRGEGNLSSGGPRLAGQPQPYLERQLTAYVQGTRVNPVMAPVAKQLTPQQRTELAAYYSRLQAPPTKASSSGSARGRALATRGDEAVHVQACENCHGPGGTGLHDLNPYLAGLDRRYLEAALREWKDGSRKTDPSQQMTIIGRNLSVADLQAVAMHYASQPAPQPMGAAEKPPAAKAASEQTRAGTATQEKKGGGVSGGEPTGSGAQGPGGAAPR